MLKSKLSLSRHFEYANKQITYHFWLCYEGVTIVGQKLLNLPGHLSSPPDFSAVRGTRSLVLYVCFVDRCLYFLFWPLCCLFFFDIRILITQTVNEERIGKCLRQVEHIRSHL
jgi:hypothetical protein